MDQFSSNQNSQSKEAAERKAQIEQQQNEMKQQMLSQILDQDARARLNTLALTKPETAQMVEAMLISMAQRRQLTGKVTEAKLKEILNDVAGTSKPKVTVKFDRRRAAIDSDDEDNFDDL